MPLGDLRILHCFQSKNVKYKRMNKEASNGTTITYLRVPLLLFSSSSSSSLFWSSPRSSTRCFSLRNAFFYWTLYSAELCLANKNFPLAIFMQNLTGESEQYICNNLAQHILQSFTFSFILWFAEFKMSWFKNENKKWVIFSRVAVTKEAKLNFQPLWSKDWWSNNWPRSKLMKVKTFLLQPSTGDL